MTDQHYKTLEGGSINYGYYKQSGRRMRNDAVHALFTDIGNIIGALAARVIAGAALTRKDIKTVIVTKTAPSTKRERQVWRIG